MPIIHVHSVLKSPDANQVGRLRDKIASQLNISSEYVWVLWNTIPTENQFRSNTNSPIAMITCKESHSPACVTAMMGEVQAFLVSVASCKPEDVYVSVQTVAPSHLLVRGEFWNESSPKINATPIGFVKSPRKDLEDDYWGSIVSQIDLDKSRFSDEAFAGLEEFSHINVVFFMHKVSQDKIQFGARHPRNREDWPKVGVFAQRAKGRPNTIGTSTCKILKIEGTQITVLGLDALDGTPVLDIKPYMTEFAPQGDVKQPEWSHDVMRDYYAIK